jgi:hypothetical protein
MLNAGAVNEPRLEYLPAAKMLISDVFTRKSALQKIR